MGYRFNTGKVVQAQTVKSAANSRFQITGGTTGTPTIIQTRAATAGERRAARESAGGLNVVREYGDYYLLPSSLRDLYLTGSHGLTSLYPTIILTTPRSAGIVDISTGLTTTPFIIDINNEVKKSIESNVRNLIDEYGTTLGITNSQYVQNTIEAQKYADSCLQAALLKDKLVRLFSVLNIDVQNFDQNQNYVIDGLDYQFLNNNSDIFEFLKQIDELGQIKFEDWQKGSNTKNLAQIFKFLSEQIVLGKTEIPDASNIDTTFLINGRNDSLTVTNVKALKEINPPTLRNTRTGAVTPNLAANVSTSQINMSFYQELTAQNIASMVSILQRDLIVQSVREPLLRIVNVRSRNIEDALAQIIGKYRDYAGQTTPFNNSLNDGVVDVNEFFENSSVFDATNLLVAVDGNQKILKLDNDKGIDYLLYKDLVQTTSAPSMQTIIDFTNEYEQLTTKLKQFYSFIFRNDSIRKSVVTQIRDMIITFINGSKLDTDELASDSSALRTGCLMAAAVNPNVAKKLFRLMCVLDKKNNYAQNPGEESPLQKEFEAAIGDLIKESDGVDRGVIRPDEDTVYVYPQQSSMPFASVGETTYGDFTILPEYFEGQGISFLNFHNIARSLERTIAGNLYEENQDNTDFYNKVTFKTDFSLNLSRDARAFVFYMHFLHMLRMCFYEVRINDANVSYEMKIKYNFNHFKYLKFIAENYDIDDQALMNKADNFGLSNDFGLDPNFSTTTVNIRNKYFSNITSQINKQEQVCLDLVNIVAAHASQLAQISRQFLTSFSDVYTKNSQNNLLSKNSLVNDIQLEQAAFKKSLVDRYANLLRGANYLPSAIDHNTAQAVNTKTVVKTSPEFADQSDASITRKFLIVVGLPSGLLETLRYENSASTSEHLYNIELTFKNLQITEREEESGNRVATMQYAFSSRVFISEGAQLMGGPDTKASELLSYEQIAAATKYKVIDDDGNYVDATPDQITSIMGNSNVVKNHLNSHYGKLLLKTTTGISVDEEIFDLVPQQRTYPDTENLPNYTTLADLAAVNFGSSPEDQLNKERTLRDLSRAIQLSPRQHMTSMMVSKTFERIHVIPVDIDDIISRPEMNLRLDDLAYISVVAKISLSDAQPPVSVGPAPRTRSFSNSLGERGDGQITVIDIGQFDIATQSASSVGINKMVDASRLFTNLMDT